MGRPPSCDKSNVKRGPWTVTTHGIGNWTLVPKIAGLKRCGKSCKLRWTNYLRPDLKHDSFTPQEEELIINYHKAVGSRWCLIARNLPGRTDNDVKNHWNTKLKKKLTKMGIDPLTHKPIAQTLSDFRNVTLIANTGNQFVPFTKNVNSMLIPKPEPSYVTNGPSGSNVTMLKPVIEQVQANSSNTDNLVWDFHSKLLVTNVNGPKLQCLGKEVTSSHCSSTCSSVSLTQINSPQSYFCQQPSHMALFSPSTWNEFLDTEHILSFQGTSPSTESSTLSKDNLVHFNSADGNSHLCFENVGDEGLGSCFLGAAGGNQANNHQADASSSTAGSFVDGLLEKDREMQLQLQFPELIDPSFDYQEF